MASNPNRTPFDDALLPDPHAPRDTQPLTPRVAPSQAQSGRRLPPQVVPPSALDDDDTPGAAGQSVSPSSLPASLPAYAAPARTGPLTRRLPTPTLIGLAMVGGALGLVLILALVSRFTSRLQMQNLRPDGAVPTISGPASGEIMSAPGEPGGAGVSGAESGLATRESPEGAGAPSVKIIPGRRAAGSSVAAPSTRDDEEDSGSLSSAGKSRSSSRSDESVVSGARRLDTRASSDSAPARGEADGGESDPGSDSDDEPVSRSSEREFGGGASNSSRSETHLGRGYAITPPPGWRLVQSGRRTIWRGPGGAQILVETATVGARSPRRDWEKMDAAFSRKYGKRYRSRGVSDTSLAGREAAAWEFDLETRSGTTRKLDVAVHHRGQGYAVLGSAPAGRFEQLRPQLEAALQSFELRRSEEGREGASSQSSSRPSRESSRRGTSSRSGSSSRADTPLNNDAPVRNEGY